MLNRYFNRKEFACKCGCGFDVVDAELLAVLTAVREYFHKPLTITSGNRCSEYNAKIGGSKKSQHMTGKASDIVVKDIEPEQVQDFLDARYPEKYGVGYAKTFTHIDTRNSKARWSY